MKPLLLALLLSLLFPLQAGQENLLERGRRIYLDSCASCHGISGRCDGLVAANLFVKPRDFTLGRYKIKSTADGELPLHEDLYTTIGFGMGQRNSMPAWAAMSSGDRQAVLAYIKSLYPRFAEEADAALKIIPLPLIEPLITSETIRRGQKLYDDLECWKCHGYDGSGNGPSSAALVDGKGNKISPPDLSKPWLFIRGSSRMDLYQTINIGIAGSAMPSLNDIIADEMIWDLVDFLYHEFVHIGELAPR